MINFGFIGCGHMGSILAEAVSKTETDLALSDANIEGVTKLRENDLEKAVKECFDATYKRSIELSKLNKK